MNRRLLIGSVSAAIVVGTASTFVLWSRAQAPSSPSARVSKEGNAPRLRTETLVPHTIASSQSIRLTGQIEAYRVAAVASEVTDRVVARLVERGDRIRRGQTVAELNSDLSVAALHQAEAMALRATAARRQAEAELARASVETKAAVSQAAAQLETAQAAEQKARTFTRSQELAQAEAALAAVRADEELARKDYDRYEQLVKEDTLPRQTLDRARAALDATIARRVSAEQSVSLAKEGARREDIAQASAQVSVARAGMESAQARPQRLEAIRRQVDALHAQEQEAIAGIEEARITVRKRQIVAPFDGRVLETVVETGEMVSPGQTILRLADVRTVKAVFALPEGLRDRVAVGQTISLTADGISGKTFMGVVKVVGYEADKAARTFPIEIAVSNPGERLLPGMVVRLAVSESGKNAQPRVVVPISSVASDGSHSYVFRIAEGYARQQTVTLGSPVGVDSVEILRGLSAKETIAATPQRLTDGAAVETVSLEGSTR